MRILFYSPFNQRARDVESLILALKEDGHEMFSLSQAEGNYFHPILQRNGVTTASYIVPQRPGWLYALKHLFYLIRFCHINKIDIVFSHLESANFVACVAQYFVRANVFPCRHHVDEGYLYNFDQSLYYKFINKLSRKIIVVSERAAKYMVVKEGVNPTKIFHINLGYNFALFDRPNHDSVESIKASFSCDILLLTICRLTKHKRADLAIATTAELVGKGLDVKLIILGKGEQEAELKQLVESLDLVERVCFTGYVSNVTDYLFAADFLLHPSVLESSCVVVKEAGIARLPVIVCNGVGDFDEYVLDRENGFKVDRNRFVAHASEIIMQYGFDRLRLEAMTEQMYATISALFSIDSAMVSYKALIKSSRQK